MSIETIRIVSKHRFSIGYEVRREIWRHTDHPADDVEVKAAYDHQGQYLGDWKMARFLIRKKGIRTFEKRGNQSCVCSIGFNPEEQKWYGWSHRAIYGYGIGDVVEKGDCTATSGWTDEWIAEHPEDGGALPVGFTAKTIEDAKKMAVAFAASVS